MTEQQIKEVANRLAKDAFAIKGRCQNHECDACALFPNCAEAIVGTSPDDWKIEPKATDDDKVILRNVAKEYNWLACDRNREIWVYESKPSKGECAWHSGGKLGKVLSKDMLPGLFQRCTWEDDEPWYIPDLLG